MTALDTIRALEVAATEGLWEPHSWVEVDGESGEPLGLRAIVAQADRPYAINVENSAHPEEDAEFIAASRTFVPTALATFDAVLALHPDDSIWWPLYHTIPHYGCAICRTSGPCPTRQLILTMGEKP